MSVKLKGVADCAVLPERMLKFAERLALSYEAPGLLAMCESRKGLALRARLRSRQSINRFVAEVVRAWPPESWPQA